MVILVLLIAVLSMHGTQYVSGGAHDPAAVTADHPLDAVAATALTPAPIGSADDVGMTVAPERAVAASAAPTATMPGHGIPAHVWSLCLAVLLAGAALLGATLTRRMIAAPVRALPSRARRAVHRSLLRPPDLSVLCLLRI
ncbi:hypothetical protein G3R41_08985 [Modestobacter muralis]|uniref:Uncharacterized protein n=1 Tax=Modestobacter muralis TaxID=1608614 RepID=A0A6P0H5X7_9ACTN|nr:DUF6153 family protein [Modestobacter muralis]NEN51072.1 hypothetical protein [Modestobacter muralis]